MIVKENDVFQNKRVASTNDSTLGILYHNSTPIGFVIEDEKREIKVKGETRIPAGMYRLILRRDLTPMTARYREKYPWFIFHIELEAVPGFSGIYIHIGNYEKDTDGCQVIGLDASTDKGEFINKKSTDLFREFYEEVYPILEQRKALFYNVTDN